MRVRAKFFVKSINHMHTGGTEQIAEIAMSPVFSDSDENRSWSKYTPSGELKMMITNPDAVSQFELGRSYFLDFTPADA